MKRFKWMIFILIGVSTFLYGGCSSFDVVKVTTPTETVVDSTEPTPTPVESLPPEIIENPSMQVGKQVRIGVDGVSNTINPLNPVEDLEIWVSEAMYEGLIGSDQYGKPELRLAETYSTSEDGRTYTFVLKEGLTYSNGDRVFADHYVKSLEKAVENTYFEAYHPLIEAVESIDVLDNRTLEVTFVTRSVYHIWLFAYPMLSDEMSVNGHPLGCGPFVVDTIYLNESIELRKNPFYYHENQINRLKFQVTDPTQKMTSLENGTLDLIKLDPPESNEAVFDSVSYIREQAVPQLNYTYIGMNHLDPVTGDLLVRQALGYAVKRTTLIDNVWHEKALPLDGPLMEHHGLYPKEQVLNDYAYDLEKAAALLEQSGWILNVDKGIREKEGSELIIEIAALSDVDWAYETALLLKSDWETLGIRVVIKWMDFESLKTYAFETQEAQVWLMSWDTPVDYDQGLIFQTPEFVGGFNNTRANELFDKIRTSSDPEDQTRYLGEWIGLANEELPYIFLVNPIETWGVNTRIEKFEWSPYNGLIHALLDSEIEEIE
ncbi:ABC transporter substrate-binding protein [Fusibacter tunisiensis]|uniref:Peptide/nickel transport system substrate-binding protein n=1 Tax=Fusibacter tunisiensis TaxID=1008308 RepID=A0ABS2MRY0_9FIRM|nr:ABC transporter substrate-binding protein [Fusibacter tunisiensis]MBM7562178.1 peptide/nickel transport system substrate-binding protein [Fusibacter tunisiensis]